MLTRLKNIVLDFFRHQSNSGIAIFISVIIAMIWANSPWYGIYKHLIETEISLTIGTFSLTEPFHTWVNDLLMSIFFLNVGLELKREILGGKLAGFRRAVLPVGAALGGMIMPALIFTLFNLGGPGMRGWGVPMATDIAFAVGVIALFGNRVPVSLKVFLVALAIVDDLGAVLVIAFFYTSDTSMIDLTYGLLFYLLLIIGNQVGIRNAWFYAAVGIGGVWLAFFFSGIHPTIAGVLIAFAIPGRVKVSEEDFTNDLRKLEEEFIHDRHISGEFISEEQLDTLERIKQLSDDAETPLQKIEHHLSSVVGFFILPLFALVNTGIPLEGGLLDVLGQPVSLGIIFGLIVGKFLGIFGISWIMIRFKVAELPLSVNWKMMAGVSVLAGMGFTMSLFIAELAFDAALLHYTAKVSILFASLIAGLTGWLVLNWAIADKS